MTPVPRGGPGGGSPNIDVKDPSRVSEQIPRTSGEAALSTSTRSATGVSVPHTKRTNPAAVRLGVTGVHQGGSVAGPAKFELHASPVSRLAAAYRRWRVPPEAQWAHRDDSARTPPDRPEGSNLASESRSPAFGNDSTCFERSSTEMVTILPFSSAASRLAAGLQSRELYWTPGAATDNLLLRPAQGRHNDDAGTIIDVAEECDLLAVRRPDRTELAVRRVSQPQRRIRTNELDVDVRFPGFGFAVPGEGDSCAIRRNCRIAFQADVGSERDRCNSSRVPRQAGGRPRG